MESNCSVAEISPVSRREAEIVRNNYRAINLQLRVLQELKKRQFSSLQTLIVEVFDDEVTVTGELDSFYEKQIAISACQSAWGMTKLIDRIEVRRK